MHSKAIVSVGFAGWVMVYDGHPVQVQYIARLSFDLKS